MRSSYKENNYHKLFKALVEVYQPKLIVECGVLDGYSLLAMTLAANKDCKLVGIDLFEDYEHKHASCEDVIDFFMFDPRVEVRQGDAIKAAEDFQDESVDLLHIDLSNTGDLLRDMFVAWDEKISKDGIIIFEGGSEERDEVEWMKKYDKRSILWFKMNFLDEYEYFTFGPFPSLTICRKK